MLACAGMQGLSVAIITFNEERNLADCIRSCRDLADEVVVLDSFSTDRTEEIARAFPEVRFSQHAFDGHVQQKDRAFALCRNAWVLSLDADERLSPELAAELRALEPGDRVGFRMPRLTFVLGAPIRHAGWYPQRKFRLVKRGHARWAGENPHDYLVVDGPAGELSGDLLHHSFQDVSHMVRTADSFSSIQAMNLHARGRRFPRLRAVLKPVAKFLEIFVVKRGFLDGFPGFVVAVQNAHGAFLREAKLYELSRGLVQRPSNLRPDYRPPAPRS
jgi:glycosyltransferase involved in cell wall biosynthesis